MNGQVNPDAAKIYSNMMMTDTKERVLSAIKDLVSSEELVDEIRFQLTGKKQVKFIEDGRPVVTLIKYHEPLINDFGANKLLADFRSYINSNVVLSYLEKNDIINRSKTYYTNISFELARNIVKYDIKSRENHAKIRTIMGTNFHTALSRAYNGMTVLTSLKNISVSEVRNLDQEQNKNPLQVFRK